MQNIASTKVNKAWQWLIGSLTNHQSIRAYFEPIIQLALPRWRADLLRSRIVEVRHESKDMYSLVIKTNKRFQAFKAGQYIELTVEKDGAWVSRYFSISSSPAYFKKTGLIELSIRIQSHGKITPWLPKALKTGSVVNISSAMGDFTLNPEHSSVCMIAGGSGITPFRSMLQQISLSSRNLANQQDITLLYYARSSEHFLFKKEFESFANQSSSFHLKLMDSELVGNMNAAHISLTEQFNSHTHFYICGPSPMITLGRQLLSDLNISSDHVHYEFFGPEPLSTDIQTDDAQVLFTRSNKQIVSASSNQTLLELAEKNDIKPVSGCRIGVCHQCICQKKSGVVYNSKTKTYSDTGAQEIQLCISVPVNDVVLDL
ncbi:MAG: iron-sulfur cluster-binding domain-containing protein [Bermanella sp.]